MGHLVFAARRVLALAVLVAAAQAAPPAVESAAADGWAYQMAGELLSPYCPGQTLADCPSQNAQTLRVWLIAQEAAGRSQEEVEAELVDRYGEEILGAPPARGFALTAYAVPFVSFGVGGLVVALFLRRQMARTRTRPAPAAPSTPLDPELERIVDEDLSR